MQKTEIRNVAQTISLPWSLLDDLSRRGLDVLIAVLGLLLLSPLFAVIAVLIRRDTPGPVFYRGPRAGRDGRPFGILKFRTMYERPATYQGSPVTAKDDNRITPVGRWLRDTKLNELPQLWNVLVGQMSLVGPRPEDPEIIKTWPEKVRGELLAVRPGVTSPATVLYRSEESLLHAGRALDEYLRLILPSKLRLDLLYVRHRTLLTDLDVITLTAVALLPRLRHKAVPERLLYWGPLSIFTTRYLSWLTADSLIAFAAVGLAGVIWPTGVPLDLGLPLAITFALATGLLFSLINNLFGLGKVVWARAPVTETLLLAISTALTTFLLVTVNRFIYRVHSLPEGMFINAGMLAFFGFTALRYRERLLTGLASQWLRVRGGSRLWGERVLIVGAGENSRFATWLLTHGQLARLFSIVGMVDDDPRKQQLYVDGCPILGSTRDIPRLIKQYDVGITVYTISHIPSEEQERILASIRSLPVKLVILPDVLSELAARFSGIDPVNGANAHPEAA